MRNRKVEVLADQRFVGGFERRRMQEASDPGYVIVGEQSSGVPVQKSGGDENV
jgi:hypothetical protein